MRLSVPSAVRIILAVIVGIHIGVALLIGSDRALPALPSSVDALQAAGESSAWPWLHIVAAFGLALGLASGKCRLAAWLASVCTLASWTLVLGMWRLTTVVPAAAQHSPSATTMVFGVGLSMITAIAGFAWVAEDD